ncbi:hypothetical protein N0V84_005174 [Fusarium piperis]|uniref:Uncharacterized protein n=1 Tax=Fusarium piperis TaxID=1435070 RepID=A0A9W8WE75_9HYPO|nr:hypothetical protein N0V84_005174 [Fusarium piperis]
MALRTVSGKIFATSLVAVVTMGGTYGFMVQRRVRLVDRGQITRFETIPESFAKSKSVSEIVNAGNHARVSDSRFIALDIPSQHHDVSDEVLLAKFVKGYFGGAVIGPERRTLQTFGLNLVHFTKAAPVARTDIWSRNDLSDTKLPSLNTVLYGVFQTLDLHLTQQLKDGPGRTESYVDFGFGSDKFMFGGVHRFAIVRSKDEEGEETVQVHCQSMSCNPSVNKPLRPWWMFEFHKAYADLLFRDGVSEIKRWMGSA